MARLIKVAAIAATGFFRAGHFWPQEGKIVDIDVLGEDVVERLAAEPRLHLTPADDAAVAAQQADDAAVSEAIKAAIGELGPDDFDKGGKPKIEALKDRLPAIKAKITAELRDAVWADVKPT